VCDTGPGIPKSKRALIFREFQRLEETASSVRGLGLGLSIVERIGKVLGHPTGLQSVQGRGSAFWVELPLAEPGTTLKDATPVPASAGRLVGLSVLCIDNEPAVLQGMQALLEGWGCRVITAQNRAEALRRLDGGTLTPDIILADYHLDDGTGFEAVSALHAAGSARAPVIVITADHSAEVQREVRRRGYALLRKPAVAAE
jgi:CheY-like chemotaxis protein